MMAPPQLAGQAGILAHSNGLSIVCLRLPLPSHTLECSALCLGGARGTTSSPCCVVV